MRCENPLGGGGVSVEAPFGGEGLSRISCGEASGGGIGRGRAEGAEEFRSGGEWSGRRLRAALVGNREGKCAARVS